MNDRMNAPYEPIIQLSDVCLRLPGSAGPVNILSNIDLKIGRGETVGVMGASGAGKTSLLMVVSGLERATSGSLTVAGQDITTMDETSLARFRGRSIGIVFQAFHLIGTMTALENVALPLELAGVANAFDLAEKTLADVGLKKRLTHFPSQLSGGEQQRVALARAFAARPELILADEPTGNLDGKTGELVMDLLFDMHSENGTTLVLVTHDTALAARCERTIHIADGMVQPQTKPSLSNRSES